MEEKPFSMVELMNADELLVTSSAPCVSPWSRWMASRGRQGPKLLKLLQDAYLEKFHRETQPQ